jgi:hypothetical protein
MRKEKKDIYTIKNSEQSRGHVSVGMLPLLCSMVQMQVRRKKGVGLGLSKMHEFDRRAGNGAQKLGCRCWDIQ